MTQEVFDKYKKIQEQFGLPQFERLQETFKIDLENEEKMTDKIRDQISDRLFMFTEKIIEPILGGIESYSSILENSMINGKERKRLFELYKKIQALKWENNLLMIKQDEKQNAVWINKTWDFWNNELETELSTLCRKLSVSWVDLNFGHEKASYHG